MAGGINISVAAMADVSAIYILQWLVVIGVINISCKWRKARKASAVSMRSAHGGENRINGWRKSVMAISEIYSMAVKIIIGVSQRSAKQRGSNGEKKKIGVANGAV